MSLVNEAAVKPLKLRFPGKLEDLFREDYYYKSLNQLRFGIALGTSLFAAFGVLDALIYPEVKALTWFVRYAVVCPVCLVVLLCTYSRRFKPYMQPAVLAAVLVSGSGIVAMMVLVRSPINYFHFAGLLLVLMYSFTFSKLRFGYTTLAAWTIVAVYEVAALRIMHTPVHVFLNDNFFYVSANLIGMFSSYHRELYMRKDFLQNLTVKELEEKNHLMEKEKILRDLHDGIGGIATNISLLADLAQKATTLDAVRKTLATISELSREELVEIRNYMSCLDAREMTWGLLSAELGCQGKSVIEAHGMAFDLAATVEGASDRPGSLLWLNLIRIYKEALTNIVKHARANSVRVELRVDRDRLVLAIADDGRGLHEETGKGRGLANMKTRGQEIGGALTVTSGNGTAVRLVLPLPVHYSQRTADGTGS
jgi:signal transduction histidine kinase